MIVSIRRQCTDSKNLKNRDLHPKQEPFRGLLCSIAPGEVLAFFDSIQFLKFRNVEGKIPTFFRRNFSSRSGKRTLGKFPIPKDRGDSRTQKLRGSPTHTTFETFGLFGSG